MKKDVKWGLLPEVLSGITINNDTEKIRSSPYYKAAISIFEYLSKQQRQDGAIFDPNVSSTLDAQCHHVDFGLSSVILSILNNGGSYYDKAYKSLKYYIDVPMERKKSGVDFSNFPILLAYILLKNNDNKNILSAMLNDYIAKMVHHATIDNINTYGNNFITLRALNHLLRFKISGDENDKKTAQHLIDCTLKWQFDDGIFYDYPRDFNYHKGIPSLAYHSWITLLVLLFAIISKEKHVLDKALYALEAMAKLVASDGEAFYYGRTNNALYGYACGISAFSIASNYFKNNSLAQRFKECEKSLFIFCTRHIAEDGHIHIVPNRFEDERCGFDSYMYVTVYNAFTMPLFLLSAIIEDTVCATEYSGLSEVHHLKESGFIIKKGSKMSTAFNLKGHNHYQLYLLDPRFTGGTPLFIKFNGHDILPNIPLSSPPYTQGRMESIGEKIKRKATEAISEIKEWGYLEHYNPLHAGFIPFLAGKNNLYMPLNIIKSDVSMGDNMLIIKCKSRYISVKSGGFWPFVLFMANAMRRYINISDTYLKGMLLDDAELYLDRTIIIDDGFIHFHDSIFGEIEGRMFFTIRTYSDGSTELKDNRFQFKKEDSGFVLLLEEEEFVKEQKALCSSKGKAYYLEIASKNGYLDKNKKNVVMKHTLIPYDKEGSVEEAITHFNSLSSVIGKYCN